MFFTLSRCIYVLGRGTRYDPPAPAIHLVFPLVSCSTVHCFYGVWFKNISWPSCVPGTVVDTENKTMKKTHRCLIQASSIESVRGGMKSLVIPSCGFIFCMSIRLDVWLVPREVGVRTGAIGGSGCLVWSVWPAGRFPRHQDAPELPLIVIQPWEEPQCATAESRDLGIRSPSSATFDLCVLVQLNLWTSVFLPVKWE